QRPAIALTPLIWGGGHQGGLRSGTLNVPGIVGMGRAAALAGERMAEDAAHLKDLRNVLWRGLQEKIPRVQLNGDPERRLPGNLNVCFPGVPADKLLLELKEIALSAGSACTSDQP